MIFFRGWPFLGALILIGFIAWLIAPGPTTPSPAPQAVESWQLPQSPRGQPERAVQILSKTSLWGKLPDAPASAPLNDPAWRILGVVKNGPERFVMIQVEGQPGRTLTINDTFPGGSRILKIEDDSICLLINGKKRTLAIYRQAPQVL